MEQEKFRSSDAVFMRWGRGVVDNMVCKRMKIRALSFSFFVTGLMRQIILKNWSNIRFVILLNILIGFEDISNSNWTGTIGILCCICLSTTKFKLMNGRVTILVFWGYIFILFVILSKKHNVVARILICCRSNGNMWQRRGHDRCLSINNEISHSVLIKTVN